jgi:hypothetical protein
MRRKIVSTLAYAQLTNVREAASPGTSTTAGSPGLRTYVDAFAALVPAEVLTLHALIIAQTTETKPQPRATGSKIMETATTIPLESVTTLQFAFWGLVVLSIVLYIAPRFFGGTWDRYDWIRVTIAPLAFFGWTMLQRTTAFDAAFASVQPIPRTVAALFLGAILGAITAGLAMKADAKPKNVAPAPVVIKPTI